jgi:cation:H+ antiporter
MDGYIALGLVIASIIVLWKSADWFVDGMVGVAEKMGLPHMLVGLVLASLATTAPELMTSLIAALRGEPELALGNAVGSVIVDASVALGLAALVASSPLLADPKLLKTSGLFLISVAILCFVMSMDGTLARHEGATLVGLYVAYTAYAYIYGSRRRKADKLDPKFVSEELEEIEEHIEGFSTKQIALLFLAGAAGVLIGSHMLVSGATQLAELAGMSSVVIGLTVVALGTSVPEIATATAAAYKGKSSLGVGNIIGADILNICWIAGLSSMANPLTAEKREIFIMFPVMLVVVFSMLLMLRQGFKLTRANGAILVSLYVAYVFIALFYLPQP